jgi:hypothetical protein
MKKLMCLIAVLMVTISCKTTKNKMIPSDKYTLTVEAINNMMPPTGGGSRLIYAIINIDSSKDNEHKWKFKNAVLTNQDKSFTLDQFDHDIYFEKDLKRISTNLRGIPIEIGNDFDIEVNLISEKGKKLQLTQKGVKVSTVH